ncbi:hypothetical protein [Vulgatibacter incomptus]|uniref:Lipoprotein n=1 Tax=Vulgatibacter incomptus TaxID=1391653 RepID=A0A0K1PHJ5_9BACT|nr:hypothetical protein [Vulgatibacter incomptus]AKU92871.1 hypothetical protein AKJ08_3258 [Vulgatibacter incomptus]
MDLERKQRFCMVIGVAVLAGAGCKASARLEEQRAALDREQVERMNELERLEARLLETQARTRSWEELGERHHSVVAIACENAASHVEGMERNAARQAEKRLLQRHQLAEASPTLQEPPPRTGETSNASIQN